MFLRGLVDRIQKEIYILSQFTASQCNKMTWLGQVVSTSIFYSSDGPADANSETDASIFYFLGKIE